MEELVKGLLNIIIVSILLNNWHISCIMEKAMDANQNAML